MLRLYPASFRKRYEGEAMLLIRDRFRDETGFVRRARLWWDLVVDALGGLPSAYRNSYGATEDLLSLGAASGPSFHVLVDEPLGQGSIFVAGMTSLMVLLLVAFELGRPIAYQSIYGANGQMSPVEAVVQRLNRGSAGDSGGSDFQQSSRAARAGGPGSQTPASGGSGSEAAMLMTSQSDKPAKMSFEVASIRVSKPGTFTPPNFALDGGDSYAPFADPGGQFLADFPLSVYIQFAYQLPASPERTEAMLARLPKWVTTDHFEIRAKADGHPTKDQMRLMLQSLLADRFGLVAHFETQETPVLALLLDKPGKTGPNLRSHAEGPPCNDHPDGPTPHSAMKADGVFPPDCGSFMLVPAANHEMMIGSRDATMKTIADTLPSVGRLGRPLVDETGLAGRFDFTMHWEREAASASQAWAEAPAELQGPTFQEALKDQLGLKLKATRAPVDFLVVDHVERPSEN
ncbi:CHP03435 domain-containing protein [Granulicella sibirica]|uniref:CHP03435 domain-containing protein n=1 Tax=Granulicella sibirica TaxID=2479048 RepID=A0A4Q0T1L0_9BACT|nr:CHP03435 domain-containing protein [Granulicella sibirica]